MAALVDAVIEAGVHATTPQRYVAALSRALEPLLPHDHLELLLADVGGGRHYRLGEHVGGSLWVDPSLEVGRDLLDPAAIADAEGRILLADACREARWPRGYFTADGTGRGGASGRSGSALRRAGRGCRRISSPVGWDQISTTRRMPRCSREWAA